MVDVAVPTAAPLSAVRRVELIHTGEWQISSGRWRASPEDLAAAVAALDCPAVRRPVLKLGHSQGEQPLWVGNPTGAPAVGWVDNLATTNSGHTLVGDFVGMPGWLGDVAASAYPDRSVEGSYEHRCQIGHTHPFVLTAVALLGVTPPGVGTLRSLQDVGALYGVQAAGTTVYAHLTGEHNQQSHGNRGPGLPDLPSSILSTVLDTAAGPLTVDARPDGLHLSYGSNRSGALDRKAAWQLADLLRRGPSDDDDDDDEDAGRSANSVATYDRSKAPPSGFAQVTQDGPQFELELLATDETLPLTRKEARQLADLAESYGVARRFDVADGTVDLWLDGKQVGLRVPSGGGDRVELRFPAADWGRLQDALNIAWEGFDEIGKVTDPDRDISSLRVDTSLGTVIVTRHGDVDAPESTLEIAAADGDWSINWPADSRHPFFDATAWLEELAEAKDIHIFSEARRLRGVTVVAAVETEHMEGLTLGDSGVDVDLWSDGSVTLGWSGYQTLLGLAASEHLVARLNEVRSGQSTTGVATADGLLRLSPHPGGDIELAAGTDRVLLSDDDAFDLQTQLIGWLGDQPDQPDQTDGVEARRFNPTLHPRWPKGTPGGLGGRFMPRGPVPRVSGATESRSRRRTTPPSPLAQRGRGRRVRTGVTRGDRARTSTVLTDLEQSLDQVPAARRDSDATPALVDQVRDIRSRVDTDRSTPDEVQQLLAQLVFRSDVVIDPDLSDRLSRAVAELREPPPATPAAPRTRRGMPEGLPDQLRTAGSREQAHQLLTPLTRNQLRAVADEVGAAHGSGWRKQQIVDSIVQVTVDFRQRSDAIMRGGGGPGSVGATVQVAAAADVHTGAMVALLPSEEDRQRLAADGGELVDQLHVTLLFLGEAAAYSEEVRQQLVAELREAAEVIPPGDADGFAVAAFNPNNGSRDTAIVLELGGDGLEDVHGLVEAAVDEVAGDAGLILPEQHTPWRPHVTLVYTDELRRVVELADRTGPIRFDRLRVAFAGENTDIPLTGEPSDDPDLNNLTDDDMPAVDGDRQVVAQQSRRITRSDRPLRRYWLRGKGAAKIRWNTPGDWTRCVRQLRRHVRDPKGLCAVYHRSATGVWPGDRRNVGRRNASAPPQEAIMPNPNPTIVHAAAAVSVDDVRTAYYRQAPQQAWIREFHTEPKRLIVANDSDGSVARVDFDVDDAGQIQFAEPVPVRVEYVEDDDAEKVAASRMVYASAAESRPTVVTVPPPPGFEPADPPNDVQAATVSNRPWSDYDASDYTPEQWRRATLLDRGEAAGDADTKERYGLPVREPDGTLNRNGVHAAAGGHGIGAVEGISDELRRSTARKIVRLYRDELGEEPPDSLLTLAGQSTAAAADDPTPTPTPDPPETPAAEPGTNPSIEEDDMPLSTEVYQRLGLAEDAEADAVNAAVLAALDKAAEEPKTVTASLPEGVVTIEASVLDDLKEKAELGAKAAERQRQDDRDRTIEAAVADGRIAPARKEHWTKAWEADPDGTREVLASLEPGLVVPTDVQGSIGKPADLADDDLPPEPEYLFGPTNEPALAGKE